MMKFRIADRWIGEGQPVFIIAELSANHGQQYETAVKTIETAKAIGADAVKLQTYTPDTLTIDSDRDCFQIKGGTPWDGLSLHQLYREAYTPWEWQPKLKKIAEDLGLICFSSPFDRSAVDFLETIAMPAYKIASFEITDIPLIEYIAEKGKPVLISTGIASREDIVEAIDACKRMGNQQIALLKCTSAYPTPLREVNLKTLADMKDTFDAVMGLSDHTLGRSVPLASVALGSKIIEKHLILDRALGGADAAFSMEPEVFRAMVQGVREVEAALGEVSYALGEAATKNRQFARSLFVVENIQAGEPFTEKNIRSVRPGFGLHPKYWPKVLGKKSKIDMNKGTPLHWHHVEGVVQ
ncbi:MAG: pseudaminic acid synthase [Nitrospiria bacterium]